MNRQLIFTGPKGRTALSASAAVIALVLAAGQAQAQANDACGPAMDGAVDCPAGLPLPTGVQYDEDNGILVRLEDGLSIDPLEGYAAVYLTSNSGSIQIQGPGADLASHNASGVVAIGHGAGDVVIDLSSVTTQVDAGVFGHGVDVTNDFGNTAITVGTVATKGDGAIGIISNTLYGATAITSDSVTTNGDYALGVVANSVFGAIDINVGSIDVTGFASDAITVSTGGDINITAGDIHGAGDYVWGVNASNGVYVDGQIFAGSTNINIGSIDIKGDYGAGVILQTYGGSNVSVDELTIDGVNGTGISVIAVGDSVIRVGDAKFTGIGSGGIVTQSYGSAFVTVGSLTAENGGGIAAQGVAGIAYVDAGTVDVSGDFAVGIQAASNYSDAVVLVDSVKTHGVFANGIRIEAFQGSAQANIGSVSADGDYSSGVVVFGGDTLINVRDSVTTTGSGGNGILTSSTLGDAIVNLAGTVTTSGDRARGIWATGRYGTAIVRTVGAVATTGADAAGIYGTGEDGQVDIVANSVKTTGADSDGISGRTRFVEVFQGQDGSGAGTEFSGDIAITAAKVEVTGAGSMGITARGLGAATIIARDVSARDNFAIETDMIGNASVDLRGIASSTLASAISAQGADVSVTIGSGGRVIGAVDGLIVSAVGERCTQRNDGVSVNPCPNPGDYFSYPDAPPAYEPVGLAGTATVVNQGRIEAGSGYAVRVTHGDLSLTNAGLIIGAIQAVDGYDLVNNTGVFELTKSSDFGGGVDLFRNSGVVRFNKTAKTASSITLANLERFENSGLIDLQNDAVGDVLTLSGDFVGSGKSTLALDIDVGAGKADRLVIGGAATGSTVVTLDGDSSRATLTGAGGVTVISMGAGSSATAFSLAEGEGDKGFVGYRLTYDGAKRSYALESAASSAAYRQVGLLQAADNVWASGADLWSSNGAATRDAAFAGVEAGRLWGSMQGGSQSRDWSSAMPDGARADLDYRQTRYGAQFGYDLYVDSTDAGSVRAGVTGGFGESSLDYRRTGDGFDLSTVNVGVYAGAVRNAVFANVLVKYDRHDVENRSTAMADTVDLTSSTWGVDGEVGYRFGETGLFLEPLVGLRWTNTSSDDLTNGGQTLAFEDADDLAGRIGVRVGGGTALASGDLVSFYASAHAVHQFGDAYKVTLTSGQSQALEGERVDTYAQGVFGLSYRTRSGFETFAEGQGDVGSGYDAVTGRIGVRLRF